jgi:hypothetical protein
VKITPIPKKTATILMVAVSVNCARGSQLDKTIIANQGA